MQTAARTCVKVKPTLSTVQAVKRAKPQPQEVWRTEQGEDGAHIHTRAWSAAGPPGLRHLTSVCQANRQMICARCWRHHLNTTPS